MKRLASVAIISGLLLTGCGTAEWKEEQLLGDEAFEKEDYELAREHYEKSYELKELNSTKEKIEEINDLFEKERKEKERIAEQEVNAQIRAEEKLAELQEEQLDKFEGIEREVAEFVFKKLEHEEAKTPEKLGLEVKYDPNEKLVLVTGLAREGATETHVRDNIMDDLAYFVERMKEVEGVNAFTMEFLYDFYGTDRDRILLGRYDDLSSLPKIKKDNVQEHADAFLQHPAINNDLD